MQLPSHIFLATYHYTNGLEYFYNYISMQLELDMCHTLNIVRGCGQLRGYDMQDSLVILHIITESSRTNIEHLQREVRRIL